MKQSRDFRWLSETQWWCRVSTKFTITALLLRVLSKIFLFSDNVRHQSILVIFIMLKWNSKHKIRGLWLCEKVIYWNILRHLKILSCFVARATGEQWNGMWRKNNIIRQLKFNVELLAHETPNYRNSRKIVVSFSVKFLERLQNFFISVCYFAVKWKSQMKCWTSSTRVF